MNKFLNVFYLSVANILIVKFLKIVIFPGSEKLYVYNVGWIVIILLIYFSFAPILLSAIFPTILFRLKRISKREFLWIWLPTASIDILTSIFLFMAVWELV